MMDHEHPTTSHQHDPSEQTDIDECSSMDHDGGHGMTMMVRTPPSGYLFK